MLLGDIISSCVISALIYVYREHTPTFPEFFFWLFIDRMTLMLIERAQSREELFEVVVDETVWVADCSRGCGYFRR